MSNLFDELKRRNVFKVATAYVVVGWLILQVFGSVAEPLGFPAWGHSFIIVVIVLGLPIALLFAWAYELTPDGIKKSKDVELDSSIAHHTSRKIDFVIIGALVLIIGGMGYTGEFTSKSEETRTVDAKEAAVPPSIAVLAFEDFSPNKDQEYFADGISDEILNLLAKTNAMQVTGRTSSFSFKGSKDDIPTIASKLNVAHVLEGSISKVGNKLKITAQLINADGNHIWSETYKRDLTDIFAIQEEIATAILQELKLKLLGAIPTATSNRAVDIELYNQYLLARELVRKEDRQSMAQALDILTEITRKDPTFAEAQAYLSIALTRSTTWTQGDIPFYEAIRRAEMPVKLALEFGPDTAEAQTAHCRQLNLLSKPIKAERACRKALKINPNLTHAWGFLAWSLENQYKYQEAFIVYKEALMSDPLSPYLLSMMIGRYNDRHDYETAQKLITRLAVINPNPQLISNNIADGFIVNGLYAEGLQYGLKMFGEIEGANTLSTWVGFVAMLLGEDKLVDKFFMKPHLYISYFYNDQFEEGINKVNAYIIENPDHQYAPPILIILEMAAGRYNDAFAHAIENEKRINPSGEVTCAFELALIYKKLGNNHLADPIIDECKAKLAGLKKASIKPIDFLELEVGILFYEGMYNQGIALLGQHYRSSDGIILPRVFAALVPEIQEMEEYKKLRTKQNNYIAEQKAIFNELQAAGAMK